MFLFATGLIMFSGYNTENQEEPAVNWDEKLEIDSGEAHQGPWRMNDSDFRYVDDPTLAFDEDGSLGIAWTDQAEQDIYFQMYNPAGELKGDEPVKVMGDSNIFSWLPRMVIDSGNIYLLWQEIIFSGGSHGGEILFSRSTDRGKTFSTPINLSNTKAGAGKGRLTTFRWDNGSLDLAVGPDGTLYAAWTEYEGALNFSRSTDNGERFSEPVRIAGNDTLPARAPDLAVDSNGTIHIAWSVGENNSADIHYAFSEDKGSSFTEPEMAYQSSSHSEAPKIAVDSEDTIHLVFAEKNETAAQQYRIYYTRKEMTESTFQQPKEISSDHSGQVISTGFPELTFDDEDRLFVIWNLYPAHTGRPLGFGFTYSENRGTSFTTPMPIPGTTSPELGSNGSRQGSLMRKLAARGGGEVAVVTSTFNEGNSSHIWLIRGTAAN